MMMGNKGVFFKPRQRGVGWRDFSRATPAGYCGNHTDGLNDVSLRSREGNSSQIPTGGRCTDPARPPLCLIPITPGRYHIPVALAFHLL